MYLDLNPTDYKFINEVESDETDYFVYSEIIYEAFSMWLVPGPLLQILQ